MYMLLIEIIENTSFADVRALLDDSVNQELIQKLYTEALASADNPSKYEYVIVEDGARYVAITYDGNVFDTRLVRWNTLVSCLAPEGSGAEFLARFFTYMAGRYGDRERSA